MPDAQGDSEDRGPSTRVDVAAPADEPAISGQDAPRAAREPWAEPDVDAVDELADTMPHRAVVAAPTSTPLATDEATPRRIDVPTPDDVALSAPASDVAPPAPPTATLVAADGVMEAPDPAASEDGVEQEPAGSVAVSESIERDAESLAPEEPVEARASEDAPAAEVVPSPEPAADEDEAQQLDDVTLTPDRWHVQPDEAALAAETAEVSTAEVSDLAVSPRAAAPQAPDEVSAGVAEGPVGPSDGAQEIEGEAQAAGDEAETLGAPDASELVAAESDDSPSDGDGASSATDKLSFETDWLAGEPTPIVEGTLAPQVDLAPAGAAGDEGAPTVALDSTVTTAPATEGVGKAGITECLLFGYPSAPTRPRSALPPSVPLPPPLSAQASSWSVPLPTDGDGAAVISPVPSPAPHAGPLHPPLPVAPVAPSRSSPRRVPSIAGVDTRVPQEYWIEDDPMELTRLALGLSGERPVVREAGRPLPKPRRFKRPPRAVSLVVFILVLAIIVIAVAGMVFAVEHLLAQPAPRPIVVPTHTTLPTSTPTRGS